MRKNTTNLRVNPWRVTLLWTASLSGSKMPSLSILSTLFTTSNQSENTFSPSLQNTVYSVTRGPLGAAAGSILSTLLSQAGRLSSSFSSLHSMVVQLSLPLLTQMPSPLRRYSLTALTLSNLILSNT